MLNISYKKSQFAYFRYYVDKYLSLNSEGILESLAYLVTSSYAKNRLETALRNPNAPRLLLHRCHAYAILRDYDTAILTAKVLMDHHQSHLPEWLEAEECLLVAQEGKKLESILSSPSRHSDIQILHATMEFAEAAAIINPKSRVLLALCLSLTAEMQLISPFKERVMDFVVESIKLAPSPHALEFF
jgi:hypothetical protein